MTLKALSNLLILISDKSGVIFCHYRYFWTISFNSVMTLISKQLWLFICSTFCNKFLHFYVGPILSPSSYLINIKNNIYTLIQNIRLLTSIVEIHLTLHCALNNLLVHLVSSLGTARLRGWVTGHWASTFSQSSSQLSQV